MLAHAPKPPRLPIGAKPGCGLLSHTGRGLGRTDGELPEPPHLERGLHKHHGRRFRLFTPDFATPPYLRLQGRPRWDPAFGPTPTVAQRGHHQLRDQANEVTENDSAVRRRVQTQPRRDAALGIEVAKSQKCEH